MIGLIFPQDDEKVKKPAPTIPNEFIDKMFEENVDNSIQGYNLSEAEKSFYTENIILNKEQATKICNLTMAQSNTQLWYSSRAPRITASRAHKIWRARNATNRLKYFLESSTKSDTLENFKYGHENEPKAIKKYEEVTGNKVNKCGLVIKMGKSYLAASPDGLVLDEDGEIIVLEVKCPISCKDAMIFTDYLNWNPFKKEHELVKKDAYYTQVQLQLYCCGAKKAHFFVFSSVSYRLVTVNLDEEFV